jgi:hypothetical protein
MARRRAAALRHNEMIENAKVGVTVFVLVVVVVGLLGAAMALSR